MGGNEPDETTVTNSHPTLRSRIGTQIGICFWATSADNFCAVEHPCGQCGAVVEDGRPFCPNCHAPQIKVPVHPPTAPVTEPLPPGTPEDLQPPAEPIVSARDLPVLPRRPSQHLKKNEIIWRPALSSALAAGLLAAVGTSIPIVPLAMLCMFAWGGLAVTLYRRRSGYRTVTPWMGAKLGALAGGLGFGLLSILSAFRLFAASERVELRDAFREKMQDSISSATDPDVRQAMEQFRNYISTDHGLILVMLFFLVVAALFFLLFSALGGALGAALFGRESGRKEP